MEKIWDIASPDDDELTLELASQTGLRPVLASLLVRRGIRTPESAAAFLRPSLSNLHDPFLMRDMPQAVARLRRAIADGERILVYGDYDVDGATAVALVYKSMESLVKSPDLLGYYVPNRYTEGYGISLQGIEHATAGGYSLVIALDCGIKAVWQMEEARRRGIDFIICDHHVAGPQLPDVVACLDAKRPDCPYPDKDLSGCGVGFKLMQALYTDMGLDWHDILRYADLLAVSIASDIVPMRGENRILAWYGLKRLNEEPNIGLLAVMGISGLKPGNVDMGDIVFKIGPRINAAGRMKDGADAVKLLLCDTAEEADATSKLINDSNEQRKDLDRETTKQAMALIAKSEQMRDGAATFIFQPEWSKGVIGIVASRLAEAFNRPALILTRSKAEPGKATGSARSVEGFDLYAAIESCSDLLEDFGGHTYAAGLTLDESKVPELQRRFELYASQHIANRERKHHIGIDGEVGLDIVDEEFMRQISLFEPFGPCNERPVFATCAVYDYSTSKPFGRGRRHIKLDIIDSNGRAVRSGAGFGLGKLFPLVSSGQAIDVCFSVGCPETPGAKGVLLDFKDIRPHK